MKMKQEIKNYEIAIKVIAMLHIIVFVINVLLVFSGKQH